MRLSDGRAFPEGTRLLLSRDQAWDHREVILDQAGRFEMRGVPLESVALCVRVPGYKFSRKNRSLNWLNDELVGRVDRNIDDLVILLEPETWNGQGHGEAPNGENQPSNKPLFGIEP